MKKCMNIKKIRVSVPLSDHIYKFYAEQARLLGISLPTYISMIIGKDYKFEQSYLEKEKMNV